MTWPDAGCDLKQRDWRIFAVPLGLRKTRFMSASGFSPALNCFGRIDEGYPFHLTTPLFLHDIRSSMQLKSNTLEYYNALKGKWMRRHHVRKTNLSELGENR